MGTRRNRYEASFKAKVALEAIKGERTISEIQVTLQFTVPRGGMVDVDVFSITGQKVRYYAKRFMVAGTHAVRWDGRDDNGRAVSSGLYLTRVSSGRMTAYARMILIR